MKKRALKRLMRDKQLRRQVATYKEKSNYFGWLILVIGIVLVLKDLNYLPANFNLLFNNISIWPILIVIAGIILLLRRK